MDFYNADNCVRITRGTPVHAAKDGRVIRADQAFVEMSAEGMAGFLADPHGERTLDALRGRQVWIDHGAGVLTRYAHLDGLAVDLHVGDEARQGSAFYEGQPVFQKANVQRAFVYGAEVEAEWRGSDRLLVMAHASYAFGHQPTLDQPMRRIPPLHGLVAARWTRASGALWIEGRLRAVSNQTRLSSGDRSDHRINPAGTPGWVVVSFSAGRPLGSRVEITGAIENLFNQAYRIHGSGIDGVGRSAWIGLRVKS